MKENKLIKKYKYELMLLENELTILLESEPLGSERVYQLSKRIDDIINVFYRNSWGSAPELPHS